MARVTRVAAVDCGTNSIRLLVADVADGTLRDVVRRSEVVRLGQDVDRTGRLAPEALARTLDMTRQYAALCEELGVSVVRFVATSATRDASNRTEFAAGVRAALGVDPQVASGDEEAQLSFRGATSVLGRAKEAHAKQAPYCVVDLGGGSTEIVVGTTCADAAWSMDVGSVRITERHLHSDPPTPEETAAATSTVDAAIDEALAHVDVTGVRTLVGLAGSVTSVTAHALGLGTYDRSVIDGAQLTVEQVLASCDDLLHASQARRAALGFMHPGRVDVIGAGALVWSRVVHRVAQVSGVHHVVTSEHDILDGIALSLA
ncbi:MAG: Ppx/GppA family phosphatase [Micrococcales bacterium]|nr:Ppx/GppA family phosphatase [Micrococcales bacterium]MCL2666083.1 Ppx/GppA family phosphatase [Micrococcales bacterium]